MAIFQTFNSRIGRWVKYQFSNGKARIIGVKKQRPRQPFIGIPKR